METRRIVLLLVVIITILWADFLLSHGGRILEYVKGFSLVQQLLVGSVVLAAVTSLIYLDYSQSVDRDEIVEKWLYKFYNVSVSMACLLFLAMIAEMIFF